MAFWDNWFKQPAQSNIVFTKPKEEIGYGVPGRDPNATPPSTSLATMGSQTPAATSPGGAATWNAPLTYYQPTNLPTIQSRDVTWGAGGGTQVEPPPTYVDQNGIIYYYEPLTGGWQVAGISQNQGLSAADQADIDYKLQVLASQENLNADELAMRRQELEAERSYQNQQLMWQREQWGQQQAMEQKNYLANLAAEPHSWLEYASAAGQAPVIQPWMLPLMPQEYGMPTAGQAISGWNPENMTGLPDLINPSAQYLARMGPTAQQQYYGYQQANLGQTPEETQFRMWSMAPPGGRSGLTQVR